MDYLNEISSEQTNVIEVQSMQVIYNMDDSRKLINDIRDLAGILVSCLENFNSSRIAAGKIELYRSTKTLLNTKIERLKELRN